MKKKVLAGFAAALLCAGVAIGQARATVIDGTWSASGSDPSATAPSPVSVTATFSFDDGTSVSNVSISNFATNFGATGADFTWRPSNDQLLILFDTTAGALSVFFDNVTTTPTFDSIGWKGGPLDIASYATNDGSFTPASPSPVPEPASLAIFASSLLGLGFSLRTGA